MSASTAVLGAVGGAGVYLVPLACIRALGIAERSSKLSRGRALAYAGVGVVVLAFALFAAFESVLSAAGAMLVILVGRALMPRRKKTADIVVEQTLLDDALSGTLAVELTALEAKARSGQLRAELDQEPPPRHLST